MPKIVYLAGAKQEVKGDFYRVQNTTLLHLGKAGGGVITERLRKLRFNMLYRHAYHSDPGLWKDTSIYLMALRDPIDRFVSNFYWSGLILCHGPAADECTAALTSIAKRMVNRKCDAPHPTGIIPTDYKRKNESISLKTIVPDNSLSARNSFNQVQQLLQSITMVSIILVGSLFFLYKHRRFRARYGTGAYSTSTRTPPVTPTSGQSPMAKPTPTPNRTPTRLRTCTLKIDPPVLGIP
eukprot:jgi/Psemu1/303567/fgenesh1_kg.111_\